MKYQKAVREIVVKISSELLFPILMKISIISSGGIFDDERLMFLMKGLKRLSCVRGIYFTAETPSISDQGLFLFGRNLKRYHSLKSLLVRFTRYSF